MRQKGSLTVISGFSGAGKGTIMRELLKKHPEYALSVSVTTRSPRPGEKDGVDYHFLTQQQFDRMVKEDGLLEHAGYVDHCYGTPRKYVEEAIKPFISIFHDRFKATLCIRKNIVKPYTMYTQGEVAIDYS